MTWKVKNAHWSSEGNVCFELEGVKTVNAEMARVIENAPEMMFVLANLVDAVLDGNEAKAYEIAEHAGQDVLAKVMGNKK